VINAQLALKMDQFNQLDNADPFLSPPPPSLLPTDASTSDALALPPLATYPSKEALFEAIQSWAKAHGYAFTVARSKRIKERQKVFYACDRCPVPRAQPRPDRVRNTSSRGSGCLFQVLAIETLSLGWEVRYRPEAKFNTHNHPPSQSPAAHPSHRRLLVATQNTAQSLFSAGKN
jgi:hypothetical protein